ncbi:hypothetical protein EV121DRAFT_272557 [Schizophyllum commune]
MNLLTHISTSLYQLHERVAERMHDLKKNGGSYIQIGQAICANAALEPVQVKFLPPFNDAPQVPSAIVEHVLFSKLGRPPSCLNGVSEIFESTRPNCAALTSVAVKIQQPDVVRQTWWDLTNYKGVIAQLHAGGGQRTPDGCVVRADPSFAQRGGVRAVMQTMVKLFSAQMFSSNWVHCDLTPLQLVILDHGLYVGIAEEMRRQWAPSSRPCSTAMAPESSPDVSRWDVGLGMGDLFASFMLMRPVRRARAPGRPCIMARRRRTTTSEVRG